MYNTTMKITLLTLAALTVAAQPHGKISPSLRTSEDLQLTIDSGHHHAHAHAHKKRSVITQVDTVTMQVPDVVVYVDDNGSTLSIAGGGAATPVASPTSSSTASAVEHYVSATVSGGSYIPHFKVGNNQNEAVVDVDEVVTVTAPYNVAAQTPNAAGPAPAAPVVPANQAPARPVAPASMNPVIIQAQNARPQPAAAQPPKAAPPVYQPAPANKPPQTYSPPAAPAWSPASSSSSGLAITWSPYTTKYGPCKTLQQAMREFGMLSQYSTIRIYGTDCDQVNIAMKAGAATGKKVFAGIFNINNVANEANIIINAVRANGNNWGMIDTVSIGNEDVGSKGRSVEDVANAMKTGTPILRNAGYKGPIVHVDTAGAFMDQGHVNAGICDSDTAGDYVAVNIHPFFNAATTADQAGRFVATQVQLLKANCGAINSRKHRLGKRDARVRVTESGWPKAGGANGAAVPGYAQQKSAIAAIIASVPDVVLFSAFDAQWQDAGAFGVEPHWGVMD